MHLYKNHRFRRYRAPIISLLVFVLIIGGVMVLINGTQSRSGSEQITLLKDALRRASTTCYAVEGRYPPTLTYLVDNYGVVIDSDRFIVRYDAFADNLLPDISVLEIGKEQAEENASDEE